MSRYKNIIEFFSIESTEYNSFEELYIYYLYYIFRSTFIFT